MRGLFVWQFILSGIFFLQNYFLFSRWMRLVCLKYTQESGKKCQVVAKLENDLKM